MTGPPEPLSDLLEVGQILSSASNLRSSLTRVLEILRESRGIRTATIALLDESTGEIRAEGAVGLDWPKVHKARYKVGEGITGRVVQSGKPVIVPRISREPLFLNRTGVFRGSRRSPERELSYVCVPIRADGRTAARALRLGADALLDKSMAGDALVHALHLLALGGAVYPVAGRPEIAAAHLAGGVEAGGAPLSHREAEILAGLLAGRSNKAIGRRLGISESTVKMHCKTLMRKIGAQNRTQAAVWALRHGIPGVRAAG